MAEETAKGIYAFGRWGKILDEYGLMPETRGIPLPSLASTSNG